MPNQSRGTRPRGFERPQFDSSVHGSREHEIAIFVQLNRGHSTKVTFNFVGYLTGVYIPLADVVVR